MRELQAAPVLGKVGGTRHAVGVGMQRWFLRSRLCLFALAMAACDATLAEPEVVDDHVRSSVTAAEQDPPAPPIALRLLHRALERDDLDAEQRDALAPALESVHVTRRDVRRHRDALDMQIASAVASGALDPAQFSERLDALEAAALREALAIEVALDDLHATLPAQTRADWAAETRAHPRPRHRGEPRSMRSLARALRLDDAQIVALHDALGPPPPPPAPPEADFVAEDFTASGLELTEAHVGHVHGEAERAVATLAVLLPLLDEEQHARLVALTADSPRRAPGRR
ncbi:MAG: hypothetical protein AAF721_24275 [Myxococcota bacterium]